MDENQFKIKKRWFAFSAGGDAVRLLPISGASGPDVFCKVQDAEAAIEAALATRSALPAAAPAATEALEYLLLSIITQADKDFAERAVVRAVGVLQASMPGWSPPIHGPWDGGSFKWVKIWEGAAAPAAVPEEAFLDCLAHLAGAASAYRTFAKRHPSKGKAETDALFSTRADDFDKAVERGRAALAAAPDAPAAQPKKHFCLEKLKPGGCQLHNLQCGFPTCDRAPAAQPGEPTFYIGGPYHDGSYSLCELASGRVLRKFRNWEDLAQPVEPELHFAAKAVIDAWHRGKIGQLGYGLIEALEAALSAPKEK